jgi:hypothetical protein
LTRAREVSADLEAIFGQPAQLPMPASHARSEVASRRPGPREAARRNNMASVGVVSAAALAGVAIGSLLAHVPQFARPPFLAFAESAPQPQPEPPRPATLPVLVAPPSQAPQQVVDVPVATAPEPTAAKPKPRKVRTHARTPRPARPGYASYAQVQAADRELRDAYAVAIRKGVPRSEIMEARDRWSAARHRAAHDPLRLVDDYRDIAHDLNRASDRTYARQDAHQDRGGRFQPRYAAWWR